ncbi:MAG: thiamine pyrophosphate-dependent dehydrogenase E1 component subunit alpha [Anaerolineae bacterium]|jgi:pyruvate dehydrogenase E1 component alpha subunit|nr:thiamine pyrophosphate-dependent dehydrogenase E1 component subunit alpha [Anaerolineae bacterium]MDH7473759.1 thiamine pyrophosphate-dependent dehydrogenase E1 component subunit alpha [Anaerolineae bacterium]
MAEITKDKLLWIYERMRLIREFEDRAAELFAAGQIPGFVHLYAGEEAIAVGVCAWLTDRDFITSTHRGHGHCIAKGVDVKAMMAELYGKKTGACKGKGGSMHIADVDKGMLGANGIVGAGGPLACGAGLTAKIKGTDQVTACFFGDGAAEQGTMHESMNLASIWKLPVIFVCENNGYAQTTPSRYHCAAEDIADRATAYNMPGFSVDGTDVFAVYEAAGEAIARARRGEGPTLIECKAFRYYGHFQGDNLSYYTEEEKAEQKARDPINKFIQRVLDRNLLTKAELAEIDARAKKAIDEAVKFAEQSPYPVLDEILTDVYVSY